MFKRHYVEMPRDSGIFAARAYYAYYADTTRVYALLRWLHYAAAQAHMSLLPATLLLLPHSHFTLAATPLPTLLALSAAIGYIPPMLRHAAVDITVFIDKDILLISLH